VRVIIDGLRIKSELDLHHFLADRLDFGPYYGNNLDALWDRLTTDVPRPVELIWENSEISKNLLGAEKFDKISSLLADVMERDRSAGRTDRFVVSLR
jgi:ribonuclease inhibitor